MAAGDIITGWQSMGIWAQATWLQNSAPQLLQTVPVGSGRHRAVTTAHTAWTLDTLEEAMRPAER